MGSIYSVYCTVYYLFHLEVATHNPLIIYLSTSRTMKTTINALRLAILAATSQVAFSMQQQELPQDMTGLRHLKGKSGKEKCLKAKMSTSNDYDGDVKGTVKICFTDALGEDTGSFKLKASGLPELIAGGVHIHSGE